MKVPTVGESLPRSGSRWSRNLGRLVLKMMGWRLEGSLPDLPRFIIIGVPHTSNWDFVLAMAAVFALGIKMFWIGKHTLFRPGYGWLMRRMGGIPVDRSQHHGMVEQLKDAFGRKDKLILCITPEGTRKKVTAWKTGFYHIAKGADVPIVTARLDLKKKVVYFQKPIYPSGNIDADMEKIRVLCEGSPEPHHER